MRDTQIMSLDLSMALQSGLWAIVILLPLLGGLCVLFLQFNRQTPFPDEAPRPLAEGYPILGVLRFFSDRYSMYFDGISLSKTGNFSFYFGKHQIVGISGLEARKVFFQSKAMNLSQGYTLLLATTPSFEASPRPADEALHSSQWFRNTLAGMMSKENLVANLPRIVNDINTNFKNATDPNTHTGIIDIFDEIGYIVYQSTMRVIGFNKIADSEELCSTTLKLFERIEDGTSPSRIIFPWLPTPAFLRRLGAGIQLYQTFKRLLQVGEDSDQNIDDVSQSLAKSGTPIKEIIGFVLVGMRLAKLTVTILISRFVSMFQFTLCNDQGDPVAEPPMPDRKLHSPRKPSVPVKLKVERI
ncbi:hypothetical protein APSETT444_005763 [Aspergillus pseudonomiae]